MKIVKTTSLILRLRCRRSARPGRDAVLGTTSPPDVLRRGPRDIREARRVGIQHAQTHGGVASLQSLHRLHADGRCERARQLVDEEDGRVG